MFKFKMSENKRKTICYLLIMMVFKNPCLESCAYQSEAESGWLIHPLSIFTSLIIERTYTCFTLTNYLQLIMSTIKYFTSIRKLHTCTTNSYLNTRRWRFYLKPHLKNSGPLYLDCPTSKLKSLWSPFGNHIDFQDNTVRPDAWNTAF